MTDLSRTGLQLVGNELPPPESQLSLAVKLPTRELAATGHVAWTDPAHHRCGIEIDREPTRQREIGLALLQLAFEIETDRRAALLLVDDPSLAAELCVPVRRHDYIPIAIRTPLQAMCALCRDRPHVEVAVVGPHALGMDRDSVATFLTNEFPDIACITIGSQLDDVGELAGAVAEVDTALARLT